MERICELIHSGADLHLFLPESFEWLILKSGLIDGNRIQKILEQPEQVIDSKKYFSWEQYFTQLLISETRETYLKYQKKALNPVYLHEKERKEILKEMNQSPGWFSDWNQPQNRPAD